MKRKIIYLTFGISILIISLSISNIISWIDDKNKNKQLTKELKEASKIEEKEEKQQMLVNPPNDKDDIYWDYENIEQILSEKLNINSNKKSA